MSVHAAILKLWEKTKSISAISKKRQIRKKKIVEALYKIRGKLSREDRQKIETFAKSYGLVIDKKSGEEEPTCSSERDAVVDDRDAGGATRAPRTVVDSRKRKRRYRKKSRIVHRGNRLASPPRRKLTTPSSLKNVTHTDTGPDADLEVLRVLTEQERVQKIFDDADRDGRIIFVGD